MKKILHFFATSNHFWHLLGGFVVGFLIFNPYYSFQVSLVAASCLEFKDVQHGGDWDWVDWALTIVGGTLAAVLLFFLL